MISKKTSVHRQKWKNSRRSVTYSSKQLRGIAGNLRQAVVDGFLSSDPESAKFVWQYWHIPGRYTHLRTPAVPYFSPKELQPWLQTLSQIAQADFGCAEISPPWLSLYTDGCYQNWHADVPHGPWAYVFSLTKDPKKFQGGRTQILKPSTLDFWNQFGSVNSDCHSEDLLQSISLSLGELLIFDARLPHAVEILRGVSSPVEGRIVLHGWLTQPRPFIEGAISLRQALKCVDPILQEWLSTRASLVSQWHGVLTLRLHFSQTGTCMAEIISSSVIDLSKRSYLGFVNSRDLKAIVLDLGKVKVPQRDSASQLTLPLVFGPLG